MLKTLWVVLALTTASGAFAAEAEALLRDNYPAESLRLGEEGNVGMALEIGTDGKLRSCTVSRTSGYARLDRAACDIMLIHVGKLNAPVDAKGRRITAVREGSIDWRLPPGTPRPAAAPPRSPDVEIAQAAEKITCTVSARQGSLGIKQKVCLTKADRDRANDYARRNRDAL